MDEQPKVQLSIYPHGILQTIKTPGGYRTYPVSAEALAQVLGRVPTASGLLPPNTIGTGVIHGVPFYVLYVPPRPATLIIEGQQKRRTITIQTPPLIWAGGGTHYRIFALAQEGYPTSVGVPLYRAPFPNCSEYGSICWGSSDARPKADPKTLIQVLDLFLEGSVFNTHLSNGKSVRHPANVMAGYKGLSARKPYPLDDMLPAERTLAWLLAGKPWGGEV
jgi:hypothetical protein